MDFKELFKEYNVQESIDKLADKYKNQKIALYGAGQYATALFENYDLSKLNIVAVADKKFKYPETEKNFFGLNCIAPNELANINCDAILISNLDYILFYNTVKNLLPKEKQLTVKIEALIKFDYILHNNKNIEKKILDYVYDSIISTPTKIENEKYLSLEEINEHLNKIYKENSLYDDLYHKNHKNRFALTLSQIPVCKKDDEAILEVGSFTWFSLFLKEILGYKNIYGLDRKNTDEKNYEITRNIMGKEHKQTVFNVDLDDKNRYDALLDSKIKFDKIIFMEVLEHLFDPTLSLINFRKILKKDGLLVLTTPNSSSLTSLWRLFNMRIPMVYARINPENHHLLHVREYTPLFLKYILKCCGYVEKSFNTVNSYHFPEKEYLYNIYPFPNQPDLNKILVHDTMVSISSPSAEIITEEPDILYDFTIYGKEEFLRHNMPIENFI